MKIAVIGAGAWGTALAISLGARLSVMLWARRPDLVCEMREARENRRFLPDIAFPAALRIESSLAAAADFAELLIVAVPLAGFRPTLERLRATGLEKPLLWACKGLEEESSKRPHQIVVEVLGESWTCGVLTGPSFAEEVAKGLPVAIALASNDATFARDAAARLHGPRLRVYANDDPVGAEVGGAVKNVMAIATGLCDGLGFGSNARAALMTRGLAEITRLGVALGGQPATFMGLAGMGDLILTCTGDLSRNRRVGLALAAGKKLPQILAELGHVAEGVATASAVARLADRLGIDMPITKAVRAILSEDLPPAVAVEQLLRRDPKAEAD